MPSCLSFVSSSTGNIRINTQTASTPGTQVQAGDNVNLYFGNVMWSGEGEQFYLFLSQDGSTQLSSGTVYTPTFSVYDVADTTATHTTNSYQGVWVTGNNWVNGTIPTSTGLGNYYIKAIDQIDSSVAVTDTYITINPIIYNATLTISPASGPGGANVQFTGSGYPASANVTFLYSDPSFGIWNYWTTTTSDSTGKISLNAQIPDLKMSASAGDYTNGTSIISFRTEVNGVAYSYVDYTQFWRGLKQVGSQIAYTLFGNGTNLASSVNVKPGDSMLISGKWFSPGVVYVRFDGVAVVGTVTADEWRSAQVIGTTSASSIGSFSTQVTIPNAGEGEHYLAIEDPQTRVIVKVNVTAAIVPTPTTPTGNPVPTLVPTLDTSLPTPVIDFSCKSSANMNVFKVEINGKLLLNENPLPGSPVLISYSVTEGNTWESLTLVKTISDGQFSAIWQPDVTGNYLVKATFERTSTLNEATKVINLALTPDAEQNVITLTSNSTITQFAFNSASKELSFIAFGPSGTQGYVNIYIPKTILIDISELKAYVDNNEISFSTESQKDNWLISFSYSHSQHIITMTMNNVLRISNPHNDSLPQWVYNALPIALVSTMAATMSILKYRSKKSQ